jgi:ABC-2 type transport system permease protein
MTTVSSTIPLPRSRPPRAGALSASLMFAWRALLKIKHVPEQLGDVIGIPILFTLMFTYLFGGAIADGAFDRFRTLPIWRPAPIVGALIGDLGRYLIAVTLVLGLGLAFASDVFVAPRTMPGWLHAFVDVNPMTHVVTAVRGLMAGAASGGQVLWALAAAAALTAVFAPLTMRLYRR